MLEHHARLLYARSLEEAQLPENLKSQSADVLHFIRLRLSIDDARELTSLSSQTPFEAKKRVFIVVSHSIAVEAQNALLKLFEEPPVHAVFYIVVPETATLLPTLRSRLFLEEGGVQKNETGATFASFFEASYGERLEQIALKVKEKDQEWIEEILKGAEIQASESPSSHTPLLEAVIQARSYIATRGASGKMLLEAIALSL